jgi:hypothetical protein
MKTVIFPPIFWSICCSTAGGMVNSGALLSVIGAAITARVVDLGEAKAAVGNTAAIVHIARKIRHIFEIKRAGLATISSCGLLHPKVLSGVRRRKEP